tara:strand:- start:380 stop:619 length:240 start_codon:yes stop_codon:yes gene_type:complete
MDLSTGYPQAPIIHPRGANVKRNRKKNENKYTKKLDFSETLAGQGFQPYNQKLYTYNKMFAQIFLRRFAQNIWLEKNSL